MYLRVTGFLSLIIILIIVVYYYLQSNHSKILEKYENYALRDCKVYFTEGDTNIKNCDITQETSNYTGSCSYRFDGWNEFDTYTDNDGKTITYPKKVYTQTRTNTNDFDNPMFTNNCFKTYTTDTCIPGQPTDNCTPPEFEYNTNGIVKYDEIGKSGNSAVGNNIYGGTGYSSMQFLNTPDPRTNNINLISSICDVPLNNTLGSLKDKVFYMFEFNATTNKLENIRSVTLNSDQTTFSPVSSDNVLMNLPLRPIDASFYGLQYDATNNNLPIKIFKKNNILRNVAIFKFNYMSYICTQSQIKNYMTARRNIYPEKFIKYGSSTIPYYSKNISISNNMKIKDGWGWSNYSSADFNQDYSDKLNEDLKTSIRGRREEIDLLFADEVRTAQQNYDDASDAYNIAKINKDNFTINYPNLYKKGSNSLIGIQKEKSTIKMFNYTSGYNSSSINNLNISIPQGTSFTKVGSDICITYPYDTNNNINGQTQYSISLGENYIADVLVVAGGGGGARRMSGGGGAGALIYATNITLQAGTYIIRVGNGGAGSATAGNIQLPGTTVISKTGGSGFDSEIYFQNTSSTPLYRAKGGSGGLGGNTSATAFPNDQSPPAGGSGGGSGGGDNGAGGLLSTLNIVNGSLVSVINNVASDSVNPSYVGGLCFGNEGGRGGGGDSPWLGSGGGGANSRGTDVNNVTNAQLNANNVGGVGGAGRVINITGSDVAYAGGGGGGIFGIDTSGNPYYNDGGVGGGGRSGTSSLDPVQGTDGLGGGGGGDGPDRVGGARGGSGIVIIRIRVNNNNAIAPFRNLTTDINTFYSNEPSTPSKITIEAYRIQSKVITSFIFLQKGYYYFRADISGGVMISSDLLIFDETNKNNSTYNNARIVYKNYNNTPMYFNKYIYIPNSKFYKLAYRYTIYNSNVAFDAYFNIYCNYQSSTNSNTASLNDASIQSDNMSGNYLSISNSTINTPLTDYLFCGNILNTHYNNANIMNLFSNVKYEQNSITEYDSIINYFSNEDFFNLIAFERTLNSSATYKNITLPNRIEDTKQKDTNIVNMQGIIGNIDRLKSNRVDVNYGSHLPTNSPSIYKDITIDEIFGKNFDRLITKDKVKDYNALFNANLNTRAPPTKKIYVEAVAA